MLPLILSTAHEIDYWVDRFRELLQRQGVEVSGLGRSLVSLEPPKPEEREAAVLVNMERTELDDDTAEHLEQWVRGGGILVLFGVVNTPVAAPGVASDTIAAAGSIPLARPTQ